MKKPKKLGLVLTAGGARAAYQVGVMRYLAETFPHFQPKIYTGVSAGSINACFLAQGKPIRDSIGELYLLWSGLHFEQVFRTNFNSFFSMATRWMYDLFISKVTRKLLLKSLLDASPLAETLVTHAHFWKISRAIRNGDVEGLAVTATNYYDGTNTIFFDSTEPIIPWQRERRKAIRTTIRARHIMASCSIPVLFEPVPIGDAIYGDGSLRYNFPLSPAIHLGSSHILAIGIRCPTPSNPFETNRPDHLSLGFVAGSVLNSIFLDSLEADYENMTRINEIMGDDSPNKIDVTLIRPSRDLGALAKDFINEVPFHFRQLIRATATPAELGDLLSYLMFSKGYINALLELGMKDAKQQHPSLAKFLKPFE